MKHSIRSLNAADGVSIVGNVGYFQNVLPPHQELGKLSKWLPQQSWFTKELLRLGVYAPNHSWRSGQTALEWLHVSSQMRGYTGLVPSHDPFGLLRPEHEPAWMAKLPWRSRKYLRTQQIFGDNLDPFAIVPRFPYQGFGYVIPEDGMIQDASDVFGLQRLAGIKQLSFIHDPVGKEADRSLCSFMYEHTRYCHSLDVHAVGNLISANLGLDQVQSNTLGTATVSHDGLTPAGGDSVKLVDPKAFDEDLHYPELLVGQAWETYRDKYSIDRDLLVRTINGEGLLGRILDIADKCSYLSRDTFAFLGSMPPRRDIRDAGHYAVADMVSDDPHICAVWESAHCRNGSLVFGDRGRMARFLKLRALMFRGLYYNPYSRFFEYLVGKGVVKHLYREGLVTREQLLQAGDEWIEGKIDDFLQAPFVLSNFHNLDHARIEEHPDYDSAAKRMREFDSDQSSIVILDDFAPTTKPGTTSFLVRKGNESVVFRDACPEDAEEIEATMKFPKLVRLYIFNADDLDIPRESRAKIKSVLSLVA